MSTKSILALALASGFFGGLMAHFMTPSPVYAQVPVWPPQEARPQAASVVELSPPREIRAHKFVLVNDAGEVRGVMGFDLKGRPEVQMMDEKRHRWALRGGAGEHYNLLPPK